MADDTQDFVSSLSGGNDPNDAAGSGPLSTPDAAPVAEPAADAGLPVTTQNAASMPLPQPNQGQVDAAEDASQGADPSSSPAPTPKKSLWENILMGALSGLAGVPQHGRGGFGAGVVGGAGSGLAFQQQQKQNAIQQQQADNQNQEANARLGIMHAQVQELTRQYDLAPKSIQDSMDQESMKMGQTLTQAGETPIATGLTHDQMVQQKTQLMQSNKDTPLNVVSTMNPDRTWSVWQVKDANKTNVQPMQVTVGFQPGKKADGSADYDNPTPVTVTAPAGTVTIANALASPVAAKVAYMQQRQTTQNQIAQKKQEEQDSADIAVSKEKALLPIKLQEEKAKQAVTDGDPNALAQLLVNGDVAPSQVISSRKPEVAQAAFSAAKKLSPTWNAQQAEGYFKAATAASNIQFFGSANSLLDKDGTLDQTQAAYNALPNGQIPAINGAVNWVDKTIGGKAPSGFEATALGLADDYSKVMTGGQGSDASRNAILATLTKSSSPAQMQQTLASMRAALASQVNGRIGQNPIMRKMYGYNLAPPPAQQQQQPSTAPNVPGLVIH